MELTITKGGSEKLTGVDDVGDVLVGLRGLLHDEFGRGDANGDALLGEVVEDLGVVEGSSGLGARQGSTLQGGCIHKLIGNTSMLSDTRLKGVNSFNDSH